MKKSNLAVIAVLAALGFLWLGSFTFPAAATGEISGHGTRVVDARQSSRGAGDLKPSGSIRQRANDDNANLSERFKNLGIDKETYLELRERHINLLRGFGPDDVPDIRPRDAAVRQMERQQTNAHR